MSMNLWTIYGIICAGVAIFGVCAGLFMKDDNKKPTAQ